MPPFVRFGLVLAVCTLRAAAQYNHSQVFFDSSGTDQAGYGANQIVTISGAVTYYGRRDPRPEGGPEVTKNIAQDFVQPASDIYLVPHGYYHGNQGANFHLFLEDVNGSPNTVLGVGGGGFFEQQIASTAPQGLLMSGEYDLVVDEHQNGYFEPDFDLYLGGKGQAPAITVAIPVGVPVLPNPGINAMKAAGNAEFKAAVSLNASFRVIEIAYDKIAADGVKATVKDVFKAIKDEFKKPPDDDAPFKLGFTAARNAMANKMKHGMGLVADPPDLNFAELVVLAPAVIADETDADPLFAAAASFANALDRESRLEAALLSSLEKYQGAAAAQSGRWALAHARGVAHYAGLLAGEISRNRPVWQTMKTATVASSVDFDALLAEDAKLQDRLRTSGFTAQEKHYLADLGLTSTQGEQARQRFLAKPLTASKAAWLAALDEKIAAAVSGPAGLSQLAAEMNAVIAALMAEPTLDRDDPVIVMGGPFTGTAGAPIALTVTATDTHQRAMTLEWDLDGDGEFDDATGAAPAVVVAIPRTGFAAVRVTNDGGRVSVAYAPLTVTSTNQLPVLSAVTPPEAAVEVEVGSTMNFSVTATDPEGGAVSLQWRLDGVEVGTGSSFAFAPALAQRGLHELAVIAKDPAGAARTRVWTVAVTRTLPLADLSVSMEAPEAPVQTGAEFTWTMTVENHGPTAAANVVLTQSLPQGLTFVRSSTSFGTSSQSAGVVTANFGTIGVGGIVTLWVQTTAPGAGSYQAVARVRSDAADSEAEDDSASARVRINAPSLQNADVSLGAVVAPSPATLGGLQTITFTTANAGPDRATGLILESQLPESVMFVSAAPAALSSEDGLVRLALPDLASGANTVASVVVRPTQAGSGPASARVYSAQGDPVLSNNETEALLSAVFAPPVVADLVVSQTAPGAPRAGLPATWTITVTNNGPDSAANVSLTDVLPAGSAFVSAVPAPASLGSGRASFQLGTLASGASRTVALTVEPRFFGEAVNRATASSASADANGADSVSAVNVSAAPTTSADVSAALSAAPASVVLNDQVTLTMTLANSGPDPATAVAASLRLPDGLTFVSASGGATHAAGLVSVSLPTLASGAQSVFTITATATAARSGVAFSEVQSADLDPDPADNRAVASIQVLNAPPQPVDLSVTQVSRIAVTTGEAVRITLLVTNRGPGAASGVTVRQTLPASLNFAAATPDQGTVSQDAGVVMAQLGTLAADETATVEVNATAAAIGAAIVNATVTSAETELVPADNASSQMIDIRPAGAVYLRGTYRFDDTLAACESDGPPLVVIDPGNADGFVTAEVRGTTRRVYRWDGSRSAGQTAGLSLFTTGLLPVDNYSVELLFRFTEPFADVRRVIDTTDRTAAGGVSLDAAHHVIAGTGAAGPGTAPPQEFHHLVLTVAPGGVAETWLDGVRQSSLTGQTVLSIPASGWLHFFSPNLAGAGSTDFSDGEIALLRVYEGLLPANRIAAQAAYPFGPAEAMDGLKQFSIAANPAGVWTYGHSTTRGTPFLYDAQQAIGANGGTLNGWGGTGGGPWILKNLQPYSLPYASILQPPDLLNCDPSFDGRNAVLRWTASAGGVYRVQGRFQGIDVSPNGTDAAVLKNGDTATTLFQDSILGFGVGKSFDVTVNLALGETVDFSVGNGGNSPLYDSTGLDAVITPVLLTDDCADGTDLVLTPIPRGTLPLNQPATLEMTVTNGGQRPAPAVVLTSALPPGFTLVLATAEGGTVQQAGGMVTASLGTLAPGEARGVSLVVVAGTAGTFTHTAQVSGGSFDPLPGNNVSSVPITAGVVVPLTLTARAPLDSVVAGSDAAFELVMANTGAQPAPGVVLRVPMPEGATFVSASGGGTVQSGAVVFPAVTIGAGQVAGLSLRLRANVPGTLTVNGLASSSSPLVREAAASAAVTVESLSVPPALQVAIATDPPQPFAGCRLTMTYTVSNQSATAAHGVILSGVIPPTLVVISTAASQGSASVSGGRLLAELGTVSQGSPVTVNVVALATAAESTALGATVIARPNLAGTVPGLVHLWDFNEPAGPADSTTVLHDLVGYDHATVRGSGAVTTGQGVRLSGGDPNTASYIDLPNGLVSPLRQVTFEGWYSVHTLGISYWSHVFSFGSSDPGGANGEVFGPGNTNGGGENGRDYISLASFSNNDHVQRFAVSNGDPNPAGEWNYDLNAPTVVGQPVHFAFTMDNTTPGLSTFRYWRNGVVVGEILNMPFNLSDLNDVNNWLGRGNYTQYPGLPASFDEFRIYDRVLTAAEIGASRDAGPGTYSAALLAASEAYTSTARALIRRNIAIPPPGSPCAVPVALRIFKAPEQQSYRLEWSATPGRKFLIQSSPDLQRWINVPQLYTATQTTESWIDPGAPSTEAAPSLDTERYYRVLELAE